MTYEAEVKKLIEQLELVQREFVLPYDASHFARQLLKELKESEK